MKINKNYSHLSFFIACATAICATTKSKFDIIRYIIPKNHEKN